MTDKEEEDILRDFFTKFISNQKDIEPEIIDVLNEFY